MNRQVQLRDSYESLFERAREALYEGNVEDAIALHRRLVDRLARLNDRVLRRRPDLRDLHRVARMELSTLLAVRGRHAEAIEVKEVLLETHPEEANVWRTDIAILRCTKGDVDAGLKELESLAQEHPEDPVGWLILGTELRLAGRLTECEQVLDKALTLCHGDARILAEIHGERFLLFKLKGQPEQAVAAWEAADKAIPATEEKLRELYTFLTDAGLYNQALRFIERDKNKMQALFQRGIIAERTGDPARARAYWEQVAALDPGDFESGHDAWVEAMLRLGRSRQALDWLRENLSFFLDTGRMFVLAAIGRAMEGDGDSASRYLDYAVRMLRHSRPVKKKLDSADWRLLDSLVADQAIKAPLKKYFAVIDTPWEEAAQAAQVLTLHQAP